MVLEAAAPCQRGWLDPWQQAARRTSPAGAWAASGHGGAGCHYVGLQAVLRGIAARAAQGCGPAGAWATSRRAVGSGCSGAAPGALRRQTGRVARSPGRQAESEHRLQGLDSSIFRARAWTASVHTPRTCTVHHAPHQVHTTHRT
eukprot:scaffold17778_cov78-Phaeocystis_antarctica.AAC.9